MSKSQLEVPKSHRPSGFIGEAFIYACLASMIWQLCGFIANRKVVRFRLNAALNPVRYLAQNPHYHFDGKWFLLTTVLLILAVVIRNLAGPAYTGSNKGSLFGGIIELIFLFAGIGTVGSLLGIGGAWLLNGGTVSWNIFYLAAAGWSALIFVSSLIVFWHLPERPYTPPETQHNPRTREEVTQAIGYTALTGSGMNRNNR